MQRDSLDVMWGAGLALLGVGVAGYAAISYDIGSLRRMGPGFFPLGLGGLLAGLGATIALPAIRRSAESDVVDPSWRQAIWIVAALLFFGVALQPLGLVLSAAGAAGIATLAAPRPGALWRATVALVVAALAWLIFLQGLDMPLPVWPEGLR